MRPAVLSAAMIVAALIAPVQARNVQARLVDQNGHAFTLQAMHGAPLAVVFVSAHCTDACPLIDGQFARVSGMIKAERLPLRLLTVTLDPERDSPATMRHLARMLNADSSVWRVAGGNVTDVHAVMNAFGVTVQRGRDGYADVHTTFVYLLDKRGRLRATMLASNHLDRELMAQVKKQWRDLTS